MQNLRDREVTNKTCITWVLKTVSKNRRKLNNNYLELNEDITPHSLSLSVSKRMSFEELYMDFC